MFRSPMTFSTSVGEPLTKVLRVVLTPSGAEKSFLKQHWRILPTQGVAMTRTARAMAGKKRMIVENRVPGVAQAALDEKFGLGRKF